ncbi:hypothetical protein LQ327_10825 [Actinomycetospora endophytica]|uniref:Uncharacterized protein n=1 Tax=Actinomycetospora endophytica TaxID=2291215 RepID=A0ABS8P7J1_9PSEU|nr:hypothetical protein [Actinomycetospora endophytica]MCD2193867.1 hypothetical protein [Actinomycetospora endophytica]
MAAPLLAPGAPGGQRAEFWLDLVASLCASPLDHLPDAVVADAGSSGAGRARF